MKIAARTPLALLFAALCVAAAPAVSAERPVRFGVMALDNDPASGEVAAAVAAVLRKSGYEVASPLDLERALSGHRAGAPAPDLSERFAAIPERMREGTQAFFYGAHAKAIEALTPAFNLGVAHPEVLARRSDIASLVYEAGTILLRAHQEERDTANARAVAALLARVFPTQLPSTRTSPPEIQDYVRAVRAEELGEATSIRLISVASRSGCPLTVNGLPARANQEYAADPGRALYIKADCGIGDEMFVWSYTPKPGVAQNVPVLDGAPLSVGMKNAALPERETAERHMRFVRTWGEVDVLIGVSEGATARTGETSLLARVERDKKPIWSDTGDRETLTKILPRLLSEFELDLAEDDLLAPPRAPGVARVEPGSGGGAGAWPWILAGTGAGVAIVGGFLAWNGQQDLNEIECAEGTDKSMTSACDGVDGPDFDDLGPDAASQEREFNARRDDALGSRTTGFIVAGVGAAALIGGVTWGALTGRDSGSALRLQVAPGELSAQVSFSF